MPDHSPRPDPAGANTPPRTPRWVWASLVVVGVLIAIGVVVLLVGGGEHGPDRHLPTGAAPAIAAAVAAAGPAPLAGTRR